VNLGAGPSGTLDLNDNDLVIDYSSGSSPIGSWTGSAYTGIARLIQSGRNGGAWNGPGITTSKGNSNYYVLGFAESTEVLGISGTSTGVFGGRTVDANAVLVKFTYGGDANLDGKLNIDDYVRIDSGIAAGWKLWYNGDFNVDGTINIDDYTNFIDSNIGNQNGLII
jgi:hypothetical protein